MQEAPPPCELNNFTRSSSHIIESLENVNSPQLRDEFMELGVIMVEGHLQLRDYGTAVILGHRWEKYPSVCVHSHQQLL